MRRPVPEFVQEAGADVQALLPHLDVYLGHVSTRTSRVEIPLDLRPSSPLKKSARDQRNGEKRGRWQAVAMKIFSTLVSHDITVCPAERVNWWWKPLFFSGINLRCARERTSLV